MKNKNYKSILSLKKETLTKFINSRSIEGGVINDLVLHIPTKLYACCTVDTKYTMFCDSTFCTLNQCPGTLFRCANNGIG